MKYYSTFRSALAAFSLVALASPDAFADGARVSAADVITSPVGTAEEYTKTASGCFQMFETDWFEDNVTPAKIVFGDNNEVYFPDILSKMPMGSYVKGVRDGDKIIVSLPQVVSYSDEWGYVLEIDINLGKASEIDGQYSMTAVEGENQVTFSVADDGSLTLDPLDEGYGVALFNAGSNMWYCVMENKIKYVPKTGSAVETMDSDGDIVSEAYFDFAGNCIENPGKGIYVKKVRYAGGLESSSKVVVR